MSLQVIDCSLANFIFLEITNEIDFSWEKSEAI